MSNTPDSITEADHAVIYQIKIEGHLPPQWTEWFEGLSVTQEAGNVTRLTGPVSDQAALYGLLKKVRDLGMPLLSVSRIVTGEK